MQERLGTRKKKFGQPIALSMTSNCQEWGESICTKRHRHKAWGTIVGNWLPCQNIFHCPVRFEAANWEVTEEGIYQIWQINSRCNSLMGLSYLWVTVVFYLPIPWQLVLLLTNGICFKLRPSNHFILGSWFYHSPWRSHKWCNRQNLQKKVLPSL